MPTSEYVVKLRVKHDDEVPYGLIGSVFEIASLAPIPDGYELLDYETISVDEVADEPQCQVCGTLQGPFHTLTPMEYAEDDVYDRQPTQVYCEGCSPVVGMEEGDDE